MKSVRSDKMNKTETAGILPVHPAAKKPIRHSSEGAEKIRYHVRIREIPTDDRPRERLIQYGANTLSVADLLAILLRTGTGDRSAIGLAQYLLSHFKGLRGLSQATITELQEIHGVGPAKAAEIKAAMEFGRRMVAADGEERPYISSPQDVYNLIGPWLADEQKEHFIALLLDTKGGVIRRCPISVGDLNSTLVHPREVFTEAIRHSAASLIVAHNHPSGDPTPSPEDNEVTKRLFSAGELIGIDLLDHVIIGGRRWLSMKEKELF